MIPSPLSAAERLGVTAAYLPLLFVGLAGGFAFLVQAVAGWFEDRNP